MFTCGEGGLGVPCSPAPVTGSGRSHVQPLSVAATSTIAFLFYHTYAENQTPQNIGGPNLRKEWWSRGCTHVPSLVDGYTVVARL